MAFESLQSIIDACTAEKKSFWEIVLEDDCRERNVTKEASFAQMKKTWEAILEADASYRGDRISPSGLTGGDGQRMMEYLKTQKDKTLCGSFLGNVIADALKMGESNACMKRIVAAPTAGACGVLPAVLVPYYRQICDNTDKIIQSLYVAAGIGQVIAERASISGAAGGCQAEIGTASSMAAGALVALQGGDAQAIAHAAAISMKNLLGLVCDPVAGLVEVPCVKRNVIGAVNALSCAEMALAGITSRIPPDQVFDAMKEIGDKMDSSLKETAMGGLAATPAGMDISKEFAKKPVVQMKQNEYNKNMVQTKYKEKKGRRHKMNAVITIGRQFGSAGREIGEKVAEHFGIKCYDKELLSRAAKESGFCEEMIQNHDERPTNSFLYNLVMDTYSFGYNASSFVDMPISHKVFLAQFDTIKKIADEGPCVIVGRCADYALSEYKNSIHLFIYGDEETKVRRIMEKYNLSESKAREMMLKKDKQRQSYYNYYSSKKWGRADSYDLCINSSVLGVEGTVKLIIQYIEDFEERNKK